MAKASKNQISKMLVGFTLLFLTLFVSCSSVPLDYKHSEDTAAKLSENVYLTKSWPEAPVSVYMSDRFPEEFRQPCIEAIQKWNDEAGTPVFEYKGLAESESDGQDGLNIIYWNNAPHPEGYFGVATTYWINNDVIIEGDVVIHGEPSKYDVLTCEEGKESCRTGSAKRDFSSVALHELGHVLGFDHSSQFGDVMYPGIVVGDVSRTFSNELIAELTSVYENITVSYKEIIKNRGYIRM